MIPTKASLALFVCALLPQVAQANGVDGAHDTNWVAIAIFSAFLASTLFLTWIATRKIASRDDFFVASGNISPLQNGLAIAGDFMSAATFLGITGLMFLVGYDAYILSFAILIGWPLMLMLIAERFRNLGKFTIVDVISFRLKSRSLRILLACSSLAVISFYLVGQMVGAGKMIQLLFGIDYFAALTLVTTLISVYVIFGGMIATTWVQMIKAVLLLSGGLYLGYALLARFGFDFSAMLEASMNVHPKGVELIEPGGWLKRDFFNVMTVALTMCFGIMGLPHILMRFFTVKNAASARNSVSIATLLMAAFYILVLVIGFGSVSVVWDDAAYHDAGGRLIGGENMVALHLSKSLGGDVAFGFMAAVTFATILAVVAGLTLAGAATVAHDLYGELVINKDGRSAKPGEQLTIVRVAAAAICALAFVSGIVFERQNIAIVVALALAIAASVNFPLLFLSMFWRGLTSAGALYGGAAGLLTCFVLIFLSDSVWVKLLGHDTAAFPYVYPTIVAMPMTFVISWLISNGDQSRRAEIERGEFHDQFIRSQIGVSAHSAMIDD